MLFPNKIKTCTRDQYKMQLYFSHDQSLVQLRGPLTDALKAMDRQDLSLDNDEWNILFGAITILDDDICN